MDCVITGCDVIGAAAEIYRSLGIVVFIFSVDAVIRCVDCQFSVSGSEGIVGLNGIVLAADIQSSAGELDVILPVDAVFG